MAYESVSQAGHTAYCGNVLDILPDIADASIDLLFMDPPYNIGKQFGQTRDKWPSEQAYLDWCYQWLSLCFAKLTPTGSLYLMASTQMMPYLDIFVRQHLHVISRIVWAYDSSGVQAKRSFGSLYEPILFAVKDPTNYTFNADAIQIEAPTGAKRKLIDYRKDPPQPYKSTKLPGNVWNFARVRYRMPEYCSHPSQKPMALLERIILASSKPGDLVLDPFAGSFTSASVAQKLGRQSISIELDPDYFQAGLKRLSPGEPL